MSKKKHKKQIKSTTHGWDAHHLCYQRRHWRHGGAKALRTFHYCIILLPKDTLHREIHHCVENVPEPKEANALEALKQLQMLSRFGAISDDDPVEKRLELLASLFDCCDQPTADGFRKQLEVVHRFYERPP